MQAYMGSSTPAQEVQVAKAVLAGHVQPGSAGSASPHRPGRRVIRLSPGRTTRSGGGFSCVWPVMLLCSPTTSASALLSQQRAGRDWRQQNV